MYHLFDKDIAVKYGLAEAILLNHMLFWIEKNEANGTNYYDGAYWTYNSAKAFSEIFPYLSARQISYALKHLRDEGILKTGNYNEKPWDRTLWYAFTEYGKCIMQKCKMEDADMSNGVCRNVAPIPDNIPDNIPDKDNICSKPQKHKYGEFKHVLLTDDEYGRLCNDYTKQIADTYIRKVDEYCEMKGASYKNYNLAVRNFIRRDNVKVTDYHTPKPEDYDLSKMFEV